MLLIGQEGHATETRERRYGENGGLEVSEGPVVCLKAMLEIRRSGEKHVPVSIRLLRRCRHMMGEIKYTKPRALRYRARRKCHTRATRRAPHFHRHFRALMRRSLHIAVYILVRPPLSSEVVIAIYPYSLPRQDESQGCDRMCMGGMWTVV